MACGRQRSVAGPLPRRDSYFFPFLLFLAFLAFLLFLATRITSFPIRTVNYLLT